MASLESGYILDLGIGVGGTYIRRDSKDIRRIGADIRTNVLKRSTEKYGIDVCRIDAYKGKFPFKDGQFEKVDINFPHGKLLFALGEPSMPLWRELSRILTPGGRVTTIFDVPPEGYRVAEFDSYSMKLYEPHNLMWRSALEAGFEVAFSHVDSQFLRRLGTNFSRTTANKMKKDPQHAAYQFIATKPLGNQTT